MLPLHVTDMLPIPVLLRLAEYHERLSRIFAAEAQVRAEAEARRERYRRAWHKANRARRQKIAVRNREIMRLARRGLTNREIGERVGLHEKSVQRIVSAARRG